MARTPTTPTIPTREPAVLRLLNKHPLLAWTLLAAVVGAMAAWIVRAW